MSLFRRVRFQPDYFMSAQFAGVAVAARTGAYARKNIEVEVLPLGGAGELAQEISIVGEDMGESLIVGSTEQYILVPAQRKGAPVQAVAAMFGNSPLALAAMPGRSPWHGEGRMRIGMHDDSISLIQRMLPQAEVVGVGREEKMSLLAAGEVDAIQVYDVMETIKLEKDLGAPPSQLSLEGLGGARLGYAQLLFASDRSLQDTEQRALLKDFISATFEGWQEAGRDPRSAAEVVMSMMPRQTDHWEHSIEFHARSIEKCCDYVRRARSAGTTGAIDPLRWEQAVQWLGGSGGRPSLDSSLWSGDPLLADGDSLAARMLQDVEQKAAEVRKARGGRAAKLGLITVGNEAEGHTSGAAAAREGAAPAGRSWFNKASAGARHGIEVEQHDLPFSTTTAELCATLELIRNRCDGLQLMWPLPPHIDAEAAYKLVPPAVDIDGAHFIGSSELRGGSGVAKMAVAASTAPDKTAGWAPVTPEAVMLLLAQRGVPLAGRRALVIGRSRIVGSPLAHALLQANATVTVAHSHTDSLDELCRAADIVVSCVGQPNLIKAAWIRPGAAVVSVGSTFDEERRALISDLEPDLELFRHASLVVTTPGGVGPLSLALLLRNVVDSAARRTDISLGAHAGTPPAEAAELETFLSAHPGWALRCSSGEGSEALGESVDGMPPVGRALERQIWLATHAQAARLLGAAGDLGDRIDHHIAHAAVSHRCADGVQLTLRAYTTSTGDVTKHDLDLARQLEPYFGVEPYFGGA